MSAAALHRASRGYRAAVILAGSAAAAVSLPAALSGGLGRPYALMLAMLGILAMQFPLYLAPSDKLDMTAGVYLCAVLLFPTQAALVLISLTQVAGGSFSALRLVRQTHRPPTPGMVLTGIAFNAGQIALSALAAGLTRDLIAGPGPIGLAPIDLAAVAGAAAAFYGVNTMAVAVAIGLSLARSPLLIFGANLRAAGPYLGLLAGLGAVTAAWSVIWWLAPAGMATPVAAVRIMLARRLRAIERTFEAVEKIADDIDARDPYTAAHSRRVADYAVRIAHELGIPGQDVEVLRTAARVHDIGKARVPPAILLKVGRLTPDEEALMQEHPERGYEMLAEFSAYERGKHLVLVHHEHYGGGGYPRAIALRDAHILAQVIPVADSIDAMRSDRPYRRGLPDWKLSEILQAGSGSQWNPDVVAAAFRALNLGAADRPAEVPVAVPALAQSRAAADPVGAPN